jgi:hypothetical protein
MIKVKKTVDFGGLVRGNGYTYGLRYSFILNSSSQPSSEEDLITISNQEFEPDESGDSNDQEPKKKSRGRPKKAAQGKVLTSSKLKESGSIQITSSETSSRSKGKSKIKKEKSESDDAGKDRKLEKQKKKVAKKSRLKEKVVEIVDLYEQIRDIELPRNIYNIAKTMRLSLSDVSIVEQKQCIDFFQKNSKLEILGALLMSPENETQIKFMHETILSRPFIDILFRSLSANLIDI